MLRKHTADQALRQPQFAAPASMFEADPIHDRADLGPRPRRGRRSRHQGGANHQVARGHVTLMPAIPTTRIFIRLDVVKDRLHSGLADLHAGAEIDETVLGVGPSSCSCEDVARLRGRNAGRRNDMLKHLSDER
jgi:hypothetical protein